MSSWTYTSEMTLWIRKNCVGVEWDDVAELFNKQFNCDKTARQLRSHAHDNDIHNGIYHSQPVPKAHWRPVGSKRLDKDGYVVVKVAEPCKWRREQFVVWEKYHEPIDIHKDFLLHLDGNRQNNAIENLYKVSKRHIGAINHIGLPKNATPELVESIINVAKLQVTAVDIIQKQRGCCRISANYHYNPERFKENAIRYKRKKKGEKNASKNYQSRTQNLRTM